MCNMRRMTIRFENANDEDTQEGEMNELQELEKIYQDKIHALSAAIEVDLEDIYEYMKELFKQKDLMFEFETKLCSLREKMGKPQCCNKCGSCLEENEGDNDE